MDYRVLLLFSSYLKQFVYTQHTTHIDGWVLVKSEE